MSYQTLDKLIGKCSPYMLRDLIVYSNKINDRQKANLIEKLVDITFPTSKARYKLCT